MPDLLCGPAAVSPRAAKRGRTRCRRAGRGYGAPVTEPFEDDTVRPTPDPEPYVPPPLDEDPSATGVEVGEPDPE